MDNKENEFVIDNEYLEGRLKYLAHTIVDGDMWYAFGCPAETIATYAVYCLNIMIKSAPRQNQDKQKMQELNFVRNTFKRYLAYCYKGGAMPVGLEDNVKTTFKSLGKYYLDMLDIYSIKYR